HIANKIKQYKVFIKIDILSKLANKKYMLINMLEDPLLDAILAFFVKFFNEETDGKGAYSFFGNENIPQYLFISVVVSLFLGLTVAAEEIIKDKKILKRESFLNLSRGSYLWSKIGIMFIISAIQSALYVFVGNLILEIEGMWFAYWFVLFTTSCAANVLGLNISSAFNSAKVIYITVPLLIIPQLLFSGVIVKFDKLHPLLSSSNEVPWVGNVMFSRWSYEALAVTQSADNSHESPLFDLNQQKSNAAWKRDYWVPEMKNQLNVLADKKAKLKDFEKAKRILTNEIAKEQIKWANLECKDCKELLSKLSYRKSNEAVQMNVASFIDIIKTQSNKTYNESSNAIDKYIEKIGNKKFQLSTDNYLNESLQDLVTNRTEVNKILITKDELIQKDDPLYINTIGMRYLDAPFYSYEKHLFGAKVSTYWSNMAIIWLMTVFLILLLYYDILRKILEFKLFKGNKES
ncbi:MAG: ABC transporter permease, partial [Fluviicola sp.]